MHAHDKYFYFNICNALSSFLALEEKNRFILETLHTRKVFCEVVKDTFAHYCEISHDFKT